MALKVYKKLYIGCEPREFLVGKGTNLCSVAFKVSLWELLKCGALLHSLCNIFYLVSESYLWISFFLQVYNSIVRFIVELMTKREARYTIKTLLRVISALFSMLQKQAALRRAKFTNSITSQLISCVFNNHLVFYLLRKKEFCTIGLAIKFWGILKEEYYSLDTQPL